VHRHRGTKVKQGARDTERGFHSDVSLYLLGSVTDPCYSAQLLVEMRPDILVIDLRLAGVAGLAVLELLQNGSYNAPIIVMNERADRRLRDKCLRLGARFFFSEEQEFEQVRAAVAVLLGQQRTQAARGGA